MSESECAELRRELEELKKASGMTKEPQLTVRELADLEKKDWQGVLAIGTLVGFFGTVSLTMLYRPELISEILTLNTLVLMALQFYFTVKSNAG